MSGYFDVETSAEALEEDEELIEAVETAVGFAAVSVSSQIWEDVSSFLYQVKMITEAIFPCLVEYQNNPSILWADLQHLCVLLFLISVTFVVLAPYQEQKSKSNKTAGYGGGSMESNRTRHKSFGALNFNRSRMDSNGSTEADMDSANVSLNSQSSWFPLLNEESDEERFRRIYPLLYDECKYFKLLLPPQCQLVEDSVASKLRQQQQKQLAEAAKQKKKEGTEINSKITLLDEADDPAQRLQFYFRQFLLLIRSLFTYDYVSAAWTIFLWLQGIRRHRRTNSDSSLISSFDVGQDMTASSHGVGQDMTTYESAHESTSLSNSRRVNDNCGDSVATLHSSVAGAHDDDNQQRRAHVKKKKLGNVDENVANVELSENPQSCETTPPEEELKEQSKESKGLDGMVVDTVSFIQDNIKKFVGTTENGDSHQVESTKAEPAADDIFLSVSELSNNKTTLCESSNKLRGSNLVNGQVLMDENGENDSDSTTDEMKNPSPANDIHSSSAESKLRTAPWYFFESAYSEESMKKMSLDMAVPDSKGYILGDEYLPDGRCTPLLVFVNSRSGPQQGQLLITQLRRLLNPIQVWDLAHGKPEPVLESFCVLTKLRILVCGGDGTVSWIISALDSLGLKRKWPPIAILPLGTGNDLARVHGWGAGYNNESLISILEQISESYISILDRWELTVEDGKKRVHTKNFFNYFSFGIDAELALQVHYLRERRPEWFFSRFVNKAWYGVFGAEESIKGKSMNIRKEIALYADGVYVPLPTDSQGIIILNIDSYAGGVPLWSHAVKEGFLRRSQSMGNAGFKARKQVYRVDSSDDLPIPLTKEEIFANVTACNKPSSCQDGYLDIVSVRGLVHLGQIKVGIGRAQRLCQCREIRIVVKKKVAVQIDGEPWRQDKCVLHIKRKKDPAFMLHRSADDGGIETEMSKLLEWAEDRNLIDGHVHSVLMKEFSRRIESKTRQRRFRSKEHNVIENLKRAIGSTGTITSLAGGNPTRNFSLNAVAAQKHFYRQNSYQPYLLSEGTCHDMKEEEEEIFLRRGGSRSNIWGNNSFGSGSGGIAF